MRVNAPVVLGSLVTAYLVFIAIVIFTDDTNPNSMDWDDRLVTRGADICEHYVASTASERQSLITASAFLG